jgi:hypothetical protein
LLDFLESTIREAWSRVDAINEQEQSHQAAAIKAAVLPSDQALDKILRYESSLQHQLFRSLTHLERLQRMRQGENVPAPLTVEVAGKA